MEHLLVDHRIDPEHRIGQVERRLGQLVERRLGQLVERRLGQPVGHMGQRLRSHRLAVG
jgi:hypothetical protein